MANGGRHTLADPLALIPLIPRFVPLVAASYGAAFLLLFEVASTCEAYFNVSLWYPPAGLRLAALLLFGWRFVLIAFPAEFVAYSLAGANDGWLTSPAGEEAGGGGVVAMLLSAVIPSASYALAVAAVAKLPLARASGYRAVRHVTQLCYAGALGALMAATGNCVLFTVMGRLPPGELVQAISAFWIGDFIGVLTWAPVVGLVTRQVFGNFARAGRTGGGLAPPLRPAVSKMLRVRGVALETAFVCAVAALLFYANARGEGDILWYPLTLPLVWAGFRWGCGGASLANWAVSIAVTAIVATRLAGNTGEAQFMIAASLTGLVLGAFASALREERSSLEARVRNRTEALADEVERRREAEARAVTEKQRAELYLNMAGAAILACDGDGTITMVNDEGCAMLRCDRRRLEGASFLKDVVSSTHRRQVIRHFERLLSGAATTATFTTPLVRGDGAHVLIEWRAAAARAGCGPINGLLLAGLDVTERARSEEEARFLATHDALTGAYNRRRLPDLAAEAMARARRQGCGMAILFADLNGFKRVNDTLGHAAGDRILNETARRLTARVRETDRVVRVGGDEFVVVAEGVAARRDARRLGIAIARTVTRPLPLDTGMVRIGIAIGAACYPHHGHTPDALLAAADVAMYARKRRRGSGVMLATADAA